MPPQHFKSGSGSLDKKLLVLFSLFAGLLTESALIGLKDTPVFSRVKI
jgi:hypothetical protein